MSRFDEALRQWSYLDAENEYYIRKAHDADVKDEANKIANELAVEKLSEIKKSLELEVTKKAQEAFIAEKGASISKASPFITENVFVNGTMLQRMDFIPNIPTIDPTNEDVFLYYDDIHLRWAVRVKDGRPKIVSRFVVEACLIVNASAPGICLAYLVFLRGRANPLVFWDGIIDPASLRRQTQFLQKGLSYSKKDLYHESFMRALAMCKSVFFLTVPKHAGWNTTLDGRRVFVSNENMISVLSELFND